MGVNFGLLNQNLPAQAMDGFNEGQQQLRRNKIADVQMQSAERSNRLADLAMQDELATRDAYRNANGDMGKTVTALQQGGQYKSALDLQGKMASQQKEALSAQKAQLENHLKTFEVVGQVMSGVTDQVSYDQARQQIAQIVGPEAAAKSPAVYDPAVIERGKLQAMAVKDQMANKWKELDAKLSSDKFAYQQKHDSDVDRRIISEGAMNRGVQIRGQNLTDSRARETAGSGKPPVGYRFTPDGNMEAIPGGPADAKATALSAQKAAGATDVDSAVATLRDAYSRLEAGGGITSTKKGPLGNIAAATSSSGAGQVVGKFLGTDNQSARNDIAMARPALLASLMKATGMSAKQMDSNAELKLWLATATDPTLDVESNRRALEAIERKYISGAPVKPAAGASGVWSITKE